MEPGLKPRHIHFQTESLSTVTPRPYKLHRWDFKSDWIPHDMWLKSWDSGMEGSEKDNWKSTLFSVPGETEISAWKHQFHQVVLSRRRQFPGSVIISFTLHLRGGCISAEDRKRAGIHPSGLD